MDASPCISIGIHFKISTIKRFPLYKEHTVYRKLPVNYAEMLAGKAAFIHPEEKICASHLIELDNAYISPFGVVFKNGYVIKESVYSMFTPWKQSFSFYKKILLRRVRVIDEDCVVAHHSYYQNYFHFLLEIMPRLFVIKEMAPDLTLIINSNLPAFIQEYISLFGFRNVSLVRDDELVKASKIVFPTYLSRGLAYNEEVMIKMAKWLRDQLIDDTLPTPEKIFISRSKARYRKTINEEQVASILIKKGFTVVNLDGISICQQANLFKNAKWIVGSHGAGFSNMIYSSNCKLVIDLIHEYHPQDCFYNLAAVFGIDYYYFQCRGLGKDSFANNDDIEVDLAKFEAICNEYIN